MPLFILLTVLHVQPLSLFSGQLDCLHNWFSSLQLFTFWHVPDTIGRWSFIKCSFTLLFKTRNSDFKSHTLSKLPRRGTWRLFHMPQLNSHGSVSYFLSVSWFGWIHFCFPSWERVSLVMPPLKMFHPSFKVYAKNFSRLFLRKHNFSFSGDTPFFHPNIILLWSLLAYESNFTFLVNYMFVFYMIISSYKIGLIFFFIFVFSAILTHWS